MRLLLDTHALLWWLGKTGDLSPEASYAVGDPENVVYVSAATVWEISIKQARGKVSMFKGLLQEIERHRFLPLPIGMEHAEEAGHLPRIHGDPFDRMLVAQARIEGLTLVTRDRNIAGYDVKVLEA